MTVPAQVVAKLSGDEQRPERCAIAAARIAITKLGGRNPITRDQVPSVDKDDRLIRNGDNKFSSGGRVNWVERDDESHREENQESIHRQPMAADRKSGSRSCADPCDAPFRVAVVAGAP